jgi:hypothetical protein
MPLRDHFRPPISKHSSWEGFHGGWPCEIVRSLFPHLPESYVAEPRVYLGNLREVELPAHRVESDGAWADIDATPGGVATLARKHTKLRKPTLTVEADLTEEYEYEVLIFDEERNRQLVAAVEIVSPGNKDRPASRRAFVAKCAALLQERVCVSIVDLVTTRQFNLYTDLLALIDRSDPAFGPKPPATYAVTLRGRKVKATSVLDIWAHAMKVGDPLPTLPIWLNEERLIPLDLEASYEEACRVLRIR